VARFLPWLVVLALALAGCSGKGPPAGNGKSGVPLTAPGATGDADTCSVEGTVLDEEEVPVAGAQVGLLGGSLEATTTAQDGKFSFSYVPPGTYQLAISKPGYEAGAQSVRCEPGGSVVSVVKIKPIPQPHVGHVARFGPLRGMFGCGVGLPGQGNVATMDVCRTAGTEHNAKTEFPIAAGNESATSAVFELEWTATGGFGGKYLRLHYPAPVGEVTASTTNVHNVASHYIQGASPLAIRLVGTDTSKPIYDVNRTSITTEVRMSTSDPASFAQNPTNDQSSLVVYQQTFAVYAAVFYWGQPVPDGFILHT
jgi:carboxypeptidase family protein